MFNNTKWIFFDMGSTLLDETASYKRWFENASAAIGGALSPEEIRNGYIKGMAEYKATISGQLAPYGFKEKSTVHLYPSELDKPYPETAEVLEFFSKKYNLGIIANQKLGTENRLEGFGIRKYFKVIISSEEEGVSKPNLEIFLLALKRAGCKAQEAVMIGDRPDNDIYPAKQLGMRTVRVMQGVAACQKLLSADYEADITVERLADLMQY